MKNNLPIGIFDSGLGGLTVLKALQEALPEESYLYFGDTAHVPYGNKSQAAIINYTTKIITFLEEKKVKLIIIACNTASSLAIKTLQKHTQIPIIDVITPTKKIIQNMLPINKIGIIGTHNTIVSSAYNKVISRINNKIKIYSIACPLFVPIIEEGLHNHEIAHIMSNAYLAPLIKNKIELLILGCTHYPIIKPTILSKFSTPINIIDSAQETALFVKDFLYSNKLQTRNKNKFIKCFISDPSIHFEKFAKTLLKKPALNIETVKL